MVGDKKSKNGSQSASATAEPRADDGLNDQGMASLAETFIENTGASRGTCQMANTIIDSTTISGTTREYQNESDGKPRHRPILPDVGGRKHQIGATCTKEESLNAHELEVRNEVTDCDLHETILDYTSMEEVPLRGDDILEKQLLYDEEEDLAIAMKLSLSECQSTNNGNGLANSSFRSLPNLGTLASTAASMPRMSDGLGPNGQFTVNDFLTGTIAHHDGKGVEEYKQGDVDFDLSTWEDDLSEDHNACAIELTTSFSSDITMAMAMSLSLQDDKAAKATVEDQNSNNKATSEELADAEVSPTSLSRPLLTDDMLYNDKNATTVQAKALSSLDYEISDGFKQETTTESNKAGVSKPPADSILNNKRKTWQPPK